MNIRRHFGYGLVVAGLVGSLSGCGAAVYCSNRIKQAQKEPYIAATAPQYEKCRQGGYLALFPSILLLSLGIAQSSVENTEEIAEFCSKVYSKIKK